VELRQLEVFVAVAEELSITRAAQRQNVVQSAVSATLRTLERQLGVALVSRTTHKVELTDAGRVFLPEARRTLAAAAEARHAMQQVRGGLRGTLHLGIMLYSPAISVSPPRLISRFVAEYPNMEFRVQTGTSGDHAEALRRGRLDLAYVALPPEDTTGLILHPLCTQTMGLVVPVGHRLAGREQVELTELADEPFVDTTPSWGTRIAIDRAFIRAGATRTIRYEIAENHGAHDFVRHGLGVAISPPLFVGPGLVFVPIARHAPRFVISLAVRDRDLSTPVRELLRIFHQLADETGTGEQELSGRRQPAALMASSAAAWQP
jgi:DNA-binding transcriptional LysR family regulator